MDTEADMDLSLAKNFDFKIFSSWKGYNSANDKTSVAENVYVQGSQNIYKKLSGNLSVRPGQKRIGVADATASPVSSEFVWNTSWGATYPLWVANSKSQVSINDVWYTLQSSLTETRYVFDKWWDNTLKKDDCLFVNGNDYIQMWSGGSTTVLSATSTTLTKAGPTTWQQAGFTSTAFSTIGSATTQFDITNPVGTTFRYTFDGTGTDPVITTLTVPIGSYIFIEAQNFTAANNGIFIVTGSGTNYFEVTNAAGVVESNKTIGTGFIYKNYTKVLTIGGVLYAYTGGETTTTLTGVTPDPSALVATTVVLQAVVTYPNTPAAGFSNDFIKVINNQVYVGSYTSRLCYISSNSDFTNYVIPTPRLPGSPELLTLDSTLNGIGVRTGKAHISIGTGEWAIVTFTDITVGATLTQQTTVDVKPVAKLAAAYAHEFIANAGDNIVYLAQDQQVRTFGDFNQSFVAAYPSLSQEISTELMAENFSGGGLKCIGDFTYLTAPVSGKTYLYQVRQSVDETNTVVVERLWHSPFIWNATRIDEINGTVVVFSNANPQVYEVWDTGQWHDDSPSDEPLPYSCVLAFSYRNGGRRQGLIKFDKLFSEGYMTQGTPLNLTINYNYQGATNNPTVIINSIDRSTTFFTPSVGSLGDSSLGDKPLGDEIEDETVSADLQNLPKFKNINSLAQINCFEYQPVFFSDTADAQWEILAMGTNAVIDDADATFLINKQR